MSHNPSKHAHSSTLLGRGVGRRARWLVAGVASVAGLAAVSGLTGVPNLSSLTRPTPAQAEALAPGGGQGDEATEPGGQEGDWKGRQDDKQGDRQDDKQGDRQDDKQGDRQDGRQDDKEDDEKSVPCNSDKLIAALVRANAEDGATLKLAEHCTYTLTANQSTNPPGPTGLPTITQRITLKGKDTSIVRAANADAFRIFDVGTGGNLTLQGLTVNGGQDNSGQGGGGILVEAGGALTVEDSAVTHNNSTQIGGGITNRGITTVSRSNISYNGALSGGGLWSVGLLNVEDSKLAFNNVSGAGGALALLNGSTLLEKTTVENNNASSSGGGIHAASLVEAHYTTITKNTAGSTGGGIENTGGQVFLKHSTVSRNTANGTQSATGGGGINNNGQFVIEDGAVTDNTTRAFGGGVSNLPGGSLVLRRAEVARNNAVGSASVAGGIFSTGRVTFIEPKVIDNSSTNLPGGIFSNNTNFAVDDDSINVRNRPTNCVGSPATIPNCFG
jgi:predicted outer membrane repeat protein